MIQEGAYGVVLDDGKAWVWHCECGKHGEGKRTWTRDQARDDYRKHRLTCPMRSGTTSAPAGRVGSPSTPRRRSPAGARKMAAKKSAKPAAAKKKASPPKEKAVRTGKVIDEATAQAAWGRVNAGTSTLVSEAKALGYTRLASLRKAILKLPGVTKDVYLAVARSGAKRRAGDGAGESGGATQ